MIQLIIKLNNWQEDTFYFFEKLVGNDYKGEE